MRRTRIFAATAAIALTASALAGTTAGAAPASQSSTQSSSTASYVVLAKDGASAKALAAKLRASGATVTSVNEAIGLVTVSSADAGFAAETRGLSIVQGVARDRSIGFNPKSVVDKDAVERENAHSAAKAKAPAAAVVAADPLDSQLWGLEMVHAFEARSINDGDRRVTVGVLDTGVQGDHPDLAPNFDTALSRNFTTDQSDIDGDVCEFESCVDPAGWDDNGHGTHVAGTIAAAANGMGVSGIAPDVRLVNIRGGQDSGYFFLGPVTNALTYAGDVGIDVVNMSFYVDPWLYNCVGGAPEDSAAQALDQETIIAAMTRALDYAHKKNVTLVGALGNNHEDLANPRHDFSSPDYGPAAYERTIDNDTCFDLPVEGPHVIGVSAVGPSTTKSDFSNYTTDLDSGEIEVSAPGGWFRDGFGTPTHRTNGNLILSSAPLHVLQHDGLVDAAGNVTPAGVGGGVQKSCNDEGDCGYYQFLQGTSMAAPHASGVAALAVSARGHKDNVASRGLTMQPNAVRAILADRATDTACPAGGVRSYTQEGRSAEFTATCVGDAEFNGFYGAGIVNALGVVQ